MSAIGEFRTPASALVSDRETENDEQPSDGQLDAGAEDKYVREEKKAFKMDDHADFQLAILSTV